MFHLKPLENVAGSSDDLTLFEDLVFKISYRLVSEIKYAYHFSPLNLRNGF